MDRATRPLVIASAFGGSLVVGLLLMFWVLGGVKGVATPVAIGGPFPNRVRDLRSTRVHGWRTGCVLGRTQPVH